MFCGGGRLGTESGRTHTPLTCCSSTCSTRACRSASCRLQQLKSEHWLSLSDRNINSCQSVRTRARSSNEMWSKSSSLSIYHISATVEHNKVHSPLHPGWQSRRMLQSPENLLKSVLPYLANLFAAYIYFRYTQPSHLAQLASLFGITICLISLLNFSSPNHVLQ